MKTDLSCLQNSVLNEKTLETDPELYFIFIPLQVTGGTVSQVWEKPGNVVKGFKLQPSKVNESY